MSKYYGDCYCLNCLHSFKTKSKFEAYKKNVTIKVFVVMECLVRKMLLKFT